VLSVNSGNTLKDSLQNKNISDLDIWGKIQWKKK
jgi:hypothetical protein